MVRVGIIGYGAFGKFLHESWSGLEGVQVTAASARTASKAPGGGVEFFTDWRKLIEFDNVDLVSIVTPPDTHTEMSLAALAGGKHVLVDKPPSLSLAGATRLVDAANEAGRVMAVNYVLRYNPLVKALKGLNDSNALGKLRHVEITNYAGGGLPEGHWFWNRKLSGGIFVEHGVHFFDLVSFVHPAPAINAVGLTSSRTPGIEDKVAAVVKHEDGMLAQHTHCFYRAGHLEHQSLYFGFDLGSVELKGWVPLSLTIDAEINNKALPSIKKLLGQAEADVENLKDKTVTASGIDYEVNRRLKVNVSVTEDKQDVYVKCVRDAVGDVALAVEGKSDALILLKNCLDSIRIAEAAASSALGSPLSVLPAIPGSKQKL